MIVYKLVANTAEFHTWGWLFKRYSDRARVEVWKAKAGPIFAYRDLDQACRVASELKKLYRHPEEVWEADAEPYLSLTTQLAPGIHDLYSLDDVKKLWKDPLQFKYTGRPIVLQFDMVLCKRIKLLEGVVKW